MKRKHNVLIAIVGAALVLSAVSTVIGSQISSTPMYTVRMEQQSNKMHFLPTKMNEFTFTAESGYTLNRDVSGVCGEPLEVTVGRTCEGTCVGEPTCSNTCMSTCPSTCGNTCSGSTCELSCGGTCEPTCFTCDPTCDETCGGTCYPSFCFYITCLTCACD